MWRQALEAYARLPAPSKAQHDRVFQAVQTAAPSVLVAAADDIARMSSWAVAAVLVREKAPVLLPFVLRPITKLAQTHATWSGAFACVASVEANMPAATSPNLYETALHALIADTPSHGSCDAVVRLLDAALEAAKNRDVPTDGGVDFNSRVSTEQGEGAGSLSLRFRTAAVKFVCQQAERDDRCGWANALARLATHHDTVAAAPAFTRVEVTHVMVTLKRRHQWIDALNVFAGHALRSAVSKQAFVRADAASGAGADHRHGNKHAPLPHLVTNLALECLGQKAEYDRPANSATDCPGVEAALQDIPEDSLHPETVRKLLGAVQWSAALGLIRRIHFHPDIPLITIGGREFRLLEPSPSRAAASTPYGSVPPLPLFASAIDADGSWAGALHVMATMRATCGARGSEDWHTYSSVYPEIAQAHDCLPRRASGSGGGSESDAGAPPPLTAHVDQLLLRLAKCVVRARVPPSPPCALRDGVLSIAASRPSLLGKTHRL
jgi:hypothetical protein